jgi:dTDP-4-dehydrorhamnose 3,5-epimerase-like enzyme
VRQVGHLPELYEDAWSKKNGSICCNEHIQQENVKLSFLGFVRTMHFSKQSIFYIKYCLKARLFKTKRIHLC